MRASVTHINLLQRSAPVHTVAWALAALLFLTVIGSVVHGSQLRAQAQEAVGRRDDVAQQLKQVQARLAIQSGEQAKSATALALRKDVDALQPQAQAAQALIDAVRNAEGGRTDEFARPLTAMTGLSEPGLWLTALTVSAGGKRLELQGEARNGASVLRFARRANESLQPLTLHLDSLELQPATGGAASGAGSGAVSFRLY
jgi:hypothetical protein